MEKSIPFSGGPIARRIFGCPPTCDQLLPHADALVYTNRHKLPPEIAVRLLNTDLYDLVGDL